MHAIQGGIAYLDLFSPLKWPEESLLPCLPLWAIFRCLMWNVEHGLWTLGSSHFWAEIEIRSMMTLRNKNKSMKMDNFTQSYNNNIINYNDDNRLVTFLLFLIAVSHNQTSADWAGLLLKSLDQLVACPGQTPDLQTWGDCDHLRDSRMV